MLMKGDFESVDFMFNVFNDHLGGALVDYLEWAEKHFPERAETKRLRALDSILNQWGEYDDKDFLPAHWDWLDERLKAGRHWVDETEADAPAAEHSPAQ